MNNTVIASRKGMQTEDASLSGLCNRNWIWCSLGKWEHIHNLCRELGLIHIMTYARTCDPKWKAGREPLNSQNTLPTWRGKKESSCFLVWIKLALNTLANSLIPFSKDVFLTLKTTVTSSEPCQSTVTFHMCKMHCVVKHLVRECKRSYRTQFKECEGETSVTSQFSKNKSVQNSCQKSLWKMQHPGTCTKLTSLKFWYFQIK